jgi:pilus assembly protein Flp/PilA
MEYGSQGGAWVASVDQKEPTMKALVTHFARDESGATAIEYGLIATCIAIAIIAAVKGVGTNLNSTFNNVSTNLR